MRLPASLGFSSRLFLSFRGGALGGIAGPLGGIADPLPVLLDGAHIEVLRGASRVASIVDLPPLSPIFCIFFLPEPDLGCGPLSGRDCTSGFFASGLRVGMIKLSGKTCNTTTSVSSTLLVRKRVAEKYLHVNSLHVRWIVSLSISSFMKANFLANLQFTNRSFLCTEFKV